MADPLDFVEFVREHAADPQPLAFQPTPAQRAILRALEAQAKTAVGDFRLQPRQIGRLDPMATALAIDALLGGRPMVVAASPESAQALADRALAKARELVELVTSVDTQAGAE